MKLKIVKTVKALHPERRRSRILLAWRKVLNFKLKDLYMWFDIPFIFITFGSKIKIYLFIFITNLKLYAYSPAHNCGRD